jgi:hypothetical protein
MDVHFVTGALMSTLARTGRIDRLSGGVCHSDDFPAVKKRIAKFMAAGFLTLRNRSWRSPERALRTPWQSQMDIVTSAHIGFLAVLS